MKVAGNIGLALIRNSAVLTDAYPLKLVFINNSEKVKI